MHSACNLRRLLVGFFALFSFSLTGVAADAADIADYLPNNSVIHGRVMATAVPQEVDSLTQKFQAAMQNDLEWFQAFFAENGKVHPIPYHPRIGLTEVEFRRYLELVADLKWQKIGAITLTIKHLKNGGIQLLSEGDTSPLNEIRIFPGKGFVETSYGNLNEFSEVSSSNPDGAIGRWSGAQWKKSERVNDKLVAVKLAIGKRTDHGDGIIYYDVKDFTHGVGENYSYVVLYPLQ